MKTARIQFLTTEDGGRQAALSTSATHYRALAGNSLEDAQWTLIVEFARAPALGAWAACKVNYLAYDHPKCPPLTPGTSLNLFEGRRLVAHVEVTE